MQNVVEKLLSLVDEFNLEFVKLSDEEWNYQSAPDKWTKKEILGHLIDSAANNHQRFVRIQFEDNPKIIYDQNNWIKYQNYKNEEAKKIIELWYLYNHHLGYVIKNISEDSYKETCDINREQPVTLEWLIKDYVRHLEHHLNQIINSK